MYFQDTNGNLHWLSDDDIARGGMSLLPQGCIQITDEQAARSPRDPARSI